MLQSADLFNGVEEVGFEMIEWLLWDFVVFVVGEEETEEDALSDVFVGEEDLEVFEVVGDEFYQCFAGDSQFGTVFDGFED